MQISTKDWNNYIKMLSQLNEMAGALMSDYVTRYGFDNRDALIDYAYGLVTTYGEGSAALAAEMYDETAAMFGKVLPRAEVAETADYNEVAKAINGTIKHSANPKSCGNTVNRLVKRAGADTTLKNAQRDGAQFAWVPMGDTCAFCITLASNGFQYMSKKALRNGHAEHIHANCDCAYTVRFDTKSGVKGYDPDKYLAMYNGAEGKNSKEKINSLRRMRYEDPAVRAKINAQKREAYASKISVEKGLTIKSQRIGTNEVNMSYVRSEEYRAKFDRLSSDRELNQTIYDAAITILNNNKGTDTETTMIFSGSTPIINKTGKKDALGVELSPGQVGIIKNKDNLVGLHNHPTNLPPNGSDFTAAGSREYRFGLVVTHDGKIYKYSAGDKPFVAKGLNDLIDKYQDISYNLSTEEAYYKALNEYKERFGISWQLIE